MDIIVTGLLPGGTSARIAMGPNLQYGMARIMNLANGEMLVAGGDSQRSGCGPGPGSARS